MIHQIIEHPPPNALKIFLAISSTEPYPILPQSYDDYLIKKYKKERLQQCGKIIRDYQGLFTARAGISKNGIKKVGEGKYRIT